MRAILNQIMKFLRDSRGDNSAIRLVCVFSVGIYITVWAFLSIKNGKMQEMTSEQVFFVGTVVAGKVFQKKDELPPPPPLKVETNE